MSEERPDYGIVLPPPATPTPKPEPREFKSLEIALFAAMWTAFSMTLSAGVMAWLLISVLPANVAPAATVTPKQTFKIKSKVEPVEIPITFDVQRLDAITVPVKTVIAQTEAVTLPVNVKLKINTKIVQAAAESVEIPAAAPAPKRPVKQKKAKAKIKANYDGVGVPPKTGDALPPPKDLTNADRRRINSQDSITKKELLTPHTDTKNHTAKRK